MMGAPQVAEYEEEKADFFTTTGTIREGVVSLVGCAIYIAETIDMIGGLDSVVLRYSAYGFGFGCALSVALAAGSAYCHYVVNLNNQDKSPTPNTTSAEQDIEAAVPQRTENEYAPIPTEEPTTAAPEILQSKEHNTQLSLKQKAAVVADFCSDAMGTAGVLATAVNLVTGDRLAKPIKLTVLGFTLFAGALGSVAEARMCSRNLQLSNSK